MEVIGWVGTTLVVIAYIPQIHHLWAEKCAWGISMTTWLIWLAAGILLLIYAWARRDALFAVVQVINILAIAATIVLVRRSDNICPHHLSAARKSTRQ